MTNPKITITAGINPRENAVGSFLINLDSPAPVGGLSVNFNVTGSSAVQNTDYIFSAGDNITAVTNNSFTIAEGQTSAVLNVNALADNVLDANETVKLNLQTGNGYVIPTNKVNFEPKVDIATGVSPISVSTGDFNNDGKTDLAVANMNSDTVSVLLRNSENTGFDAKTDYVTGTQPFSVSAGDFNGDGKVDLAVANAYDNTISVLLRNSDNTNFDSKIDYAVGLTPLSINTGDFNNDGKLDLVVGNWNNNTVSILLRNSANTGFDTKIDYAVGASPDHQIAVADINGDKNLDVITPNAYNNTVSVLLGNGNGTLQSKTDYATYGGYSNGVATGDFNNDGKLDLAVANQTSNNISVLLRNSNNTSFETAVTYAVGLNVYSQISTGDFNNDGKLDLAVTNTGSNTVSVLVRNSANTSFNKTDFAVGLSPYSVSTSDFNNDGKLDLAVANYVDNTVSVLINNSVYSNSSLTITDVPNNLPTGKITISDVKPSVGEILTVSNTLKDADGLGVVSYSWLVSNKSVATGNSYTVATSDLGKVIKVVANYTDVLGHSESVSSSNTSQVVPASLINSTADSDLLSGTLGNDLINGLAGNDLIDGDTGNDTLNGGDGDDLIHGGAGNDIINGGLGNDVLNGGTGKDTFVFDSALLNNVDKIMDFKVIDDTLKLENAVFTQLTKTGVLSVANFIIGNTANDANDFIIYNKTSGALFYDADGNGANNPVQIAVLGVNLALTKADFVVI